MVHSLVKMFVINQLNNPKIAKQYGRRFSTNRQREQSRPVAYP